MWKTGQLARTAAVSNGMVWFGLALFFGALSAGLTGPALAGSWAQIVGWIIMVLAAAACIVMGVLEQLRMRAARARARPRSH